MFFAKHILTQNKVQRQASAFLAIYFGALYLCSWAKRNAIIIEQFDIRSKKLREKARVLFHVWRVRKLAV